MKIAISGKMGSGKSFLAEKLVNNFNFKKISFADRVKELATELFGMKEKDRSLLINLGTKMREIDPKVWINSVIRHCNNFGSCDVVVDDLRMKNEYETLKADNWLFVKIQIDEDLRNSRLKYKYQENYDKHKQHFNSITENDVVEMNDHCFHFIIKNSQDEQLFLNFIANTKSDAIDCVHHEQKSELLV